MRNMYKVGFPRLYAAASLKRLSGRFDLVYPAGFPRLYAAASLKRGQRGDTAPGDLGGFPRLYAAASLKHPVFGPLTRPFRRFSAALCRGLIEARKSQTILLSELNGFPRLYAAASLKHSALSRSARRSPWVFRGFMPRPH